MNKEKDPKKRILTTCVKMFIEKGYKETTMMDIIKGANVSASTFQNIFHTKDGVLSKLISFMFSHQFDVAGRVLDSSMNGVSIYAIETGIQLALVEQNEKLREIYVEAYTQPKLLDTIHRKTMVKLKEIFAHYLSSWNDSDFYEAEIGSAGMMRAYMARPCDMYFTFERKLNRFISAAFDIYHVPGVEQEKVKKILFAVDLKRISNDVMNKLFKQLEMAFDFKFSTEGEKYEI